MVIFKCKMCGGDLEIDDKMTVGTCNYCGSIMTLPKDTDEKKANLFNRANHFRRLNDFDKAMSAYESILNVDNSDAEAHWGVVLSRYGIEYVEDPRTHERIPTCHRVQQESILSDADYLAALEYAPDSSSKIVYEAEAKRISEIQKEILAISAKEDPFDVFICYKETTETGSRSKDSALAQDIYYQLTQEGIKVFFSRITLEDKLGKAYEPYIFAALNSVKVMVVVGTKTDNLNSAWVKNEWSRYLAMWKKDKSRLIIPCYRDMDAYDLPEELTVFQSQDMSKIGFMQDLIRGVKKIINTDEKQSSGDRIANAQGGANVESLLKRAYLFLEDGDWKSADEYCEKVLDIDPENANAYIGKLMAQMEIREESGFALCTKPLDENNNYQKSLRFANPDYKIKIIGYSQVVLENIKRKKEKELEKCYNDAISLMNAGKYKAAQEYFEVLGNFRDSAAKALMAKKVRTEIEAKEAKARADADKIKKEKERAEAELAQRQAAAAEETRIRKKIIRIFSIGVCGGTIIFFVIECIRWLYHWLFFDVHYPVNWSYTFILIGFGIAGVVLYKYSE